MKKLFGSIVFFVAFSAATVSAQPNLTERSDPKPGDQSCWQLLKQPVLFWGSIDERYSRSRLPQPATAPKLYAWKGERVQAQAVFATNRDGILRCSVSDLKNATHIIPSACVQIYFVHYVLGDALHTRKDSCLSADWLSPETSCKVEARTVRPLWLDIQVPRNAVDGTYKGSLSVSDGKQIFSLPISLTVGKRVLPEPKDWKLHLDLWQNPYAVARHYNVPLWSKEHFDRLRPLMKQYADLGGKVITASIVQHPWKCQTFDPFESMIVKMKHVDGNWTYDYTVFDRWVEFMFSCGITEQIDCYTIVPWGYTFEYVDMASSTLKHFSCMPGDKEYEAYMMPFLTDFAKHLKAKGWFDRTCIAMDERPMEQFRAAFETVRRADPGFRIKGAVDYSPEISKLLPMMYDISMIYHHADIPAEIIAQRRNAQLRTTYYTCSSPKRPNTFTFSPPAEAAWLGWHIAATGLDGYLRWALNSWTENPYVDSRYSKWPAGDCYLIYPSGSSIRYQRFLQGVQAYEKIQLLKKEFSPAQAKKMESVLTPFKGEVYDSTINAAAVIRVAEERLRKLE